MKKNYFFGLFAATMLLTTSCQQENIFTEMWGEKEQTVTLNIALPEMGTATRAYGEGTMAVNLQYAMFEITTDASGTTTRKYLADRTVTDATLANGSASVKLKLVRGSNYEMIFWADAYGATATDAPYTVDLENGKMTIDYTKILNNKEENDAFFGNTKITYDASSGFTFTNSTSDAQGHILISLYRPFAQINIATGDYEEAVKSGFAPTSTNVQVSGLYTYLNLFTGEVSNDMATQITKTYQKNTMPTEKFTLEGTDYTYLSMTYALVGASKDADNIVTITCYDANNVEKTREFVSVPLRRNWRTNIYGNMFTSESEIIIAIKPGFADGNSVDDDNDSTTDDEDELFNGENGFTTTNP